MINPYDFVRQNPDIEKVKFHKKVEFLCCCPEINYYDRKHILDIYSPDDIEEFFEYYYRLYNCRIENKEVLYL